ncbi:MAG: hypothetical protein IJ746_02710 [Ruminococcus sp.]|nr:hypothetical protein [Ruminococcus sp.]
MNKKLLAGFLSLTLALSVLTACGSSSDDDDDDDESIAPKKSLAVDSAAPEESDDTNAESQPEESAADTAAQTQAPDESVPDYSVVDENAGEPLTSALKKLGAFPYNSDMDYYGYIAIVDYDTNSGKMFDYLGNPMAGGAQISVNDIAYIDTSLGLYSYGLPSDDGQYSYICIFDALGNELIPISEKVGYAETINERYIALYYPEGITTNKDEAIYFRSSDGIAISPGEDDILYKGHISIYDLETKALVPDLKFTEVPRLKGYGDIIQVDYDYYYDSQGKELGFKKDEIEPKGSKFLFKYDREYKKYSVLDHDKNTLFTLDKDVTVYSVSDDNEYITVSKYDKDKSVTLMGVVNSKGDQVVDYKYKYLSPIGGSFYEYQTSGSSDYIYGILDAATGKELTKDEYDTIYDYEGTGFLKLKNDSGNVMIDTEGKELAKASDNDNLSYAPYYIKDGDNYKMLNYSTKEFSIDVGDYYSDYFKGILVEDKDNKAVYDVRTGDKILEGYDKLAEAYGFFYAFYGETAVVYQLVI